MQATSFMSQFGERLVVNGYPIVPIQPGTKKPGCHRGGGWRDYPAWTRHAARATTELELKQWRDWPDAGVGIVGGAVAAVDIDITDDADLAHRIERLARDRLGDTSALRIGRAPKRLLVYRTVEPFKGIKRHPLEILCLGQQFVAYAVHPTTKRPYEWPEDSLADLDISSLPAIDEAKVLAFLDEAVTLLPQALRPATLATRQSKTPPGGHSQQGTPEAVRAALAHIPNPDLDYDSWVRIGLAIKGAIGEAGAELFAAWSAQSAKNDPAVTAKNWTGFRPTSIGAGTIYHLAREHGWKPDASLELDGAAPRDAVHPAAGLLTKLRAEPAAAEAKPVTLPPIPDLVRLDGALKLLVDYILASAIRPQPWLAVGASLAALGALMGRRVRTESNLRSNLYVLGIAESGGGKDHARKAIKEALFAAGQGAHIGGERIASGAGLITALVRQPAILFQIDEFGRFMANVVDKRRAPKHLSEIWDLFTELATSAGTTFFGAEYADQKERPRQDIVEPCTCLHGVTAPGPFWEALRSGSLQDGSLARFLVFRSTDDIPDRNRRAVALAPVPAELVAALQRIAGIGAGSAAGNLQGISAPVIKPDPLVVAMDAEATEIFDALDDEMTARQRAAVGSDQSAALARVWENTAKVALIKAVSANPAAPVIRGEDAAWARDVVAHCLATLLAQAERHLADNEHEANHKKVLRLIGDAGAAGLSRTEFYRKTHFLGDRREAVLSALIQAEEVEETVVATKTKRRTAYRRKPLREAE